jgi:hypothetical protein
MGTSIRTSGSYQRTLDYLNGLSKLDLNSLLAPYGQKGVEALIHGTPRDSGIASESWTYKIVKNSSGVSLEWHNRDIENGFPVAIMLQYGYSTGTGGYVQGRDYINPAMKSIFDEISRDVRKVVTSA